MIPGPQHQWSDIDKMSFLTYLDLSTSMSSCSPQLVRSTAMDFDSSPLSAPFLQRLWGLTSTTMYLQVLSDSLRCTDDPGLSSPPADVLPAASGLFGRMNTQWTLRAHPAGPSGPLQYCVNQLLRVRLQILTTEERIVFPSVAHDAI